MLTLIIPNVALFIFMGHSWSFKTEITYIISQGTLNIMLASSLISSDLIKIVNL